MCRSVGDRALRINRSILMPRMSDPDHLDLDGHLLQLLVAVIDEGSITRAAQRLGVTQSAVSHLLDKLRAIVGDPLFVKSGRGIAPTERAQLLASASPPPAGRTAALRHQRWLRPVARPGHRHRRGQRPAARPAPAPLAGSLACASARASPAGHPLGRAQRGDAARRALRSRHLAAPAGPQRHPADPPVRGPLRGVLRSGMPLGSADAGRVAGRRACDGHLRASTPTRR